MAVLHFLFGFLCGCAFLIAVGFYRIRRKKRPCNNPKGHQWNPWKPFGATAIFRDCPDCGKREISL